MTEQRTGVSTGRPVVSDRTIRVRVLATLAARPVGEIGVTRHEVHRSTTGRATRVLAALDELVREGTVVEFDGMVNGRDRKLYHLAGVPS